MTRTRIRGREGRLVGADLQRRGGRSVNRSDLYTGNGTKEVSASEVAAWVGERVGTENSLSRRETQRKKNPREVEPSHRDIRLP